MLWDMALLRGGRTGSAGLASVGRNCRRRSDLSGVLISSPVGRNRNCTKQLRRRRPAELAPPGNFPTSFNFSFNPQPCTCPSPGKCGMMRFSMLMSPDSMGNISFSAFCGAETGTAVRMAPGDPPAAPPPCPWLVPLPGTRPTAAGTCWQDPAPRHWEKSARGAQS